MKKIISLILSVIILLSSLTCVNMISFAQGKEFDDGITASYDAQTKTLCITGEQNAVIADKFTYNRDWSSVDGLTGTADVLIIDINANISRIGAGALSDFTNAQRVIIRSSYCSIGDTTAIPEGVEICAFSGSEAESFANENGYAFRQLFLVTYNYTKTGKPTKVVAFPEGASGTEIAKNEKTYENLSDTQHTEFYFVTSTSKQIDKEKGLINNTTLTEYSRTRSCVFGGEETVPPNCVYEGYTTHTCTLCGNTLKIDGSEIPAVAKSHTYELISEITPTCTAEGEKTFTCTLCGDTKTETTDKLPHSYELKNEIAPTCTAEGKKIFTCSDCGDKITEPIEKAEHAFTQKLTPASLDKDGKITTVCTDCGYKAKSEIISAPVSITLSKTSYTYNSDVKKPKVTVTDRNGKIISSDNYKVTYASTRKKVGTYKVKITFTGNYKGTKKLYFRINPKGTSISKLSAKKKAFTVKWKKQTKQITGYQIQYSTDKNFSKNVKTAKIKDTKVTSKKLKNLKGNKKYYVRIRTYKSIGDKKYYSTWSKIKTVKTKR